MSFKDIKPLSWEECLAGVVNVLGQTYAEHAYLLREGGLDAADVQLFAAIRERRAAKSDLLIALGLLSRLLAAHHQEKVVILIDEYDTPIHAGYTRGYYDEVVAFFRDFLSGGLKDNVHLFKGVLGSGAVWSFLLFTGYLKAVEVTVTGGRERARLAVPNVEVSVGLRDMAQTWFEAQVGGTDALEALLDALLRGQAPVVERHLAHVVKVNASYFDTLLPNPKDLLPHPKGVVAKPREQLPDPREQLPHPKAVVAKPRGLLPDPREQLPNPNSVVAKPREQLPDPREQLPHPKGVVAKPREQLPNPNGVVAKPREQLPDPREQLPDPREQLPDPREQLPHPKAVVAKPRDLLPNPKDLLPHQTPSSLVAA